jgi:hypothetical protein
MKKIFVLAFLGLLCFTACESWDLDIPPKNLVTDEDLLNNEAGMDIYMARMYSRMPFEDFKYMGEWGLPRMSSWLGAFGIEGTGEAVNRDGICRPFNSEADAYWGMAFTLLRDANYLIENIPQYKDAFPEITYNHYLGEAYFARARVFNAMARRFGGVPLVTRVIEYPAEQADLEVPRSSEEETWDQVLADFDQAAARLMPKSPKSGYANRYVALAFKSEAMLYAGSVAKYNETIQPSRLTGFGQKTGVRVMGFAPESWESASKRYFKEAYLAARDVITNGGYSLYVKKWVDGTSADAREAQYLNMVEMFSDLTSTENIYVKEYLYPTMTHGYDCYSGPYGYGAVLSGGTCPTLDFMELFEGFDRYADGSVKVTDGTSTTNGHYLMYDKPMDFFANAEPRLRAYVIFPGDMFKNKQLDIRVGVYKGAEPINPFFTSYTYANAEEHYQALTTYTGNPKTLFLSAKPLSGQEKVPFFNIALNKQDTMFAAGLNGLFYDDGACLTGLYGRKWLSTDLSLDVASEGKSDQPFILMRYADVLLNAAEAGVELALAGEPSPDGSDMLLQATTSLNLIQKRAGATLTPSVTGDLAGRNIVRKERRKELAFEHKTKWDLRRWRVQHEDERDYFWGEYKDKNSFGSGSRYRFRGLYPFFSAETNRYFFDIHFQCVSLKTFEYNPIDYYFSIPGGEVTKSQFIDQQPNR